MRRSTTEDEMGVGRGPSYLVNEEALLAVQQEEAGHPLVETHAQLDVPGRAARRRRPRRPSARPCSEGLAWVAVSHSMR